MLVDEAFCKSLDVGFDRCIAGREGKSMYSKSFDGRYKIPSVL